MKPIKDPGPMQTKSESMYHTNYILRSHEYKDWKGSTLNRDRGFLADEDRGFRVILIEVSDETDQRS